MRGRWWSLDGGGRGGRGEWVFFSLILEGGIGGDYGYGRKMKGFHDTIDDGFFSLRDDTTFFFIIRVGRAPTHGEEELRAGLFVYGNRQGFHVTVYLPTYLPTLPNCVRFGSPSDSRSRSIAAPCMRSPVRRRMRIHTAQATRELPGFFLHAVDVCRRT